MSSSFKKALEEYNSTHKGQPKEQICCHENKISINNSITCEECGKIIHKEKYQDKITFTASRVQSRQVKSKGIMRDLENSGFSDCVIKQACRIYDDITQGKIYRGNRRKGIIFACVYVGYHLLGIPQTSQSIQSSMNVDKKDGTSGIKFLCLNAKIKNVEYLQNLFEQEQNDKILIMGILKKFTTNTQNIDAIYELYLKIKNKSDILKKSKFTSVISSLLYYWIKQHNSNMGIKEFSCKVDLTPLTIKRLYTEITKILDLH